MSADHPLLGAFRVELNDDHVYECGDIYETESGDTLYCVMDQGHDGMHFGKPAGDRVPNGYWQDDSPHRRANKDSLPPSG